ncbi:hypothetical protein U1Q18_000562 [Sarracenia purpurea var. burkii]
MRLLLMEDSIWRQHKLCIILKGKYSPDVSHGRRSRARRCSIALCHTLLLSSQPLKQQPNSLFNKYCSGLSYSLEKIEYGSYPGAVRMTFRDNPTSGTTGQDDRRIEMTGPSGGSISRNNPVEPGQPIDLPSLDML